MWVVGRRRWDEKVKASENKKKKNNREAQQIYKGRGILGKEFRVGI